MFEPALEAKAESDTPSSLTLDLSRIRRKSAFYFAVFIVWLGVGIAALWFLPDGRRIKEALNHLPLWTIIAVIGLALFNYAMRAWRFQYYGARLSLRAPYREMLVYYIAGFAMSMSPGKLGEAARLWFLKRRYGFAYHKGVALQIADRAGDVISTLLLCLIGMANFAPYRGAILAMIGIVAAGATLLVWPGLLLKLIRAIYGITQTRARLFVRLKHMIQAVTFMFCPDVMFVGLLLGALGWMAECYALYLVLEGIGTPIGFLSCLFIFSFSNIAGGLTMLPGGLGGVELTMFALLRLNNVPAAAATAATVVVRLCTLWFGISLGLLDLPLAVKMSGAVPASALRPKMLPT